MEGHLALGRGDAATACERFTAAARGALANGARVAHLRTLAPLARAHVALADTEGALRCLTDMARIARECGAGQFEEVARSMMSDLGVDSDAMPPGATAADAARGHIPLHRASEKQEPSERFVTVLFADVRGYTAMSARRAPADMAGRIAALQRWATREIGDHRGVIDKFAGDAVMATFNIAGATVDHCLHSLQAAIGLRDKAALVELPLGVGIAVGPAIVGHLAHGANLSVLGETTNLAARLQAQALAGEVLLSSEAFRRVEEWLLAHHLRNSHERLSLKGFATPVDVCRVLPRGTTAGARRGHTESAAVP